MPTPTAPRDPKDPLTVFKRFDPAKLKPHASSQRIYQDQPNQELLDSVRDRGVIEPLVLAADEKTIVSGRRRRQAAIVAKRSSVPCVIRMDLKDSLDIREAVLDANIHNERTNEQKAREFQERKEIEEARATIRMKATQFRARAPESRGAPPPLPIPVPEVGERGTAASLAASSVGWSVPTAEAATEVLVAADKAKRAGREEEADRLVETLNETSVAAAHRLLDKRKPPRKQESRAYNAQRLTKAKDALAALVRHMPPSVYKDCKQYINMIKAKLDNFSLKD